MPDETALREQICQIGRLMHAAQYIDGTAGNISARLGENRFLMTPSGLAKGFLQPDHLIVTDIDGNKVGPDTDLNRDLHPTSETPMHLEVYRQRPEIGGVVHAHPPYAVALSIAGIHPHTYTIPEAIVLLGEIPITDYALPASVENREAIRSLIAHHDTILLKYHGSLTVAEDVWTAYLRLESLEHASRIVTITHQLGGGPPLPAHEIAKLHETRRQLGLRIEPPINKTPEQ